MSGTHAGRHRKAFRRKPPCAFSAHQPGARRCSQIIRGADRKRNRGDSRFALFIPGKCPRRETLRPVQRLPFVKRGEHSVHL